MFTNQSTVFILIGIVVFCKLLIDFLLKTKLGFSLRALGDNETLVVSLGIDEKKLKIIGLMIANGFVAVSGGILAQYQGFSDISMGTGTIITGLASIIIGESIFKNIRLVKATTFVIVGAIIYRFIIAGSLEIGFNPSDIKLITAILTVGIMAYKSKKKKVKIKSKGGEVKNA
jgi:putative ABC transport system permease protein